MGNTIGRRKSNWVGKNRRPECGHGCMEWRLVTHGVWRSWGLSPDLGAKGGGLPSSIFSFSPGRPCFVYSSEEIGESLLAPRAGQEGGGEKRLQFPLNWEGTGGIPPGDHVCPYSNSLGGGPLFLGWPGALVCSLSGFGARRFTWLAAASTRSVRHRPWSFRPVPSPRGLYGMGAGPWLGPVEYHVTICRSFLSR